MSDKGSFKMKLIPKEEWQTIPEQAQHEVYDFFLFIKQRYSETTAVEQNETRAFSNHSANLIDDWKTPEEDAVWK